MIDELTDLVPLCNSVSHKLDKLTVLRLTVQHLKMLTRKCWLSVSFCLSSTVKALLKSLGDSSDSRSR